MRRYVYETDAKITYERIMTMFEPKKIKNVVIDGHSLTFESFIAVARFGAHVELAPEAKAAMERSRALAEKISA